MMKPIYENQCQHRREDFIGTIQINGELKDLYIYKSNIAGLYDPESNDLHFCMIESDNAGDYSSGDYDLFAWFLKSELTGDKQ